MGDNGQRKHESPTEPLTRGGHERKLRDLYGGALEQQQRVSLLVYHRDGAEVYPLSPGVPVVMGRSAAADLAVRDASLSREHARFTLDGDRVLVEDLGSTNGTRVNGERVSRAEVSAGDQVSVGAVPVAVHALAAVERGLFGLDSHDDFQAALTRELSRSATTSRPVAVMVVRADRQGALRLWSPRLRKLLQPFHRAALYSGEMVEVLLPEAGAEQARDLAQQVAAIPLPGEPRLVCGVAAYPGASAGAEALLEAALAAARRAGVGRPVILAPGTGQRTLASAPQDTDDGGDLSSRDPAMGALYETVDRVASAAAPVLILGETGSGKEVVARALHRRGDRAAAPMCCVNCAAIPGSLVQSTLFGHERGAFTGAVQAARGVFEAAHGGTVMLDEVGELPAEAQAVLLRVLETRRVVRVGSTREREVDVRVLALTHRDLDAMCAAGDFREDLLYRLNTITLEVPPLRARPADLLPLAEGFMARAARENGRPAHALEPAARQALARHPWPGNVRQLKNAMERAVLIASDGVITLDDLPARVREAGAAPTPVPEGMAPATPSPPAPPVDLEAGNLKEQVQQYEATLVRNALSRCGWNAREAAAQLGLPLRTLNHKMHKLGVVKPEEEPPDV